MLVSFCAKIQASSTVQADFKEWVFLLPPHPIAHSPCF